MADVVFLGLGQSSDFDNKDIDQVIGQEVATGRAEVVRTGVFGQILPSAKEPQATFGDLPSGPVEVQFFGEVENVPPPTANPEVEFVVTPRESGEVVGPVFNVESPDVVLGPIGESSNLLNLITPLGGFPLGDHLLPVQFDTEDVNLGIVGPLLPQSIDPASNLPPAGPYAPVPPFFAMGTVICIAPGTLQFLINTDPQRYKTDPFPPTPNENATFAITDAPNNIYPKRIRFLPDTNTPELRDFISPITFIVIFDSSIDPGNTVDTIIINNTIPVAATIYDRFLIEDAPIARETPVIEVILG